MIYLDHHAATPLSAPVRAAIARVHEHAWANPASIHAGGRSARAELERARRSIAHAVHAQVHDLVFTSGGTEACNLAVLGLASGARRIVTSELEHPAMLAAVQALHQRGSTCEYLPLRGAQPPSLAALEQALASAAELVVLQWVNHETGAIAPVYDYAKLCRARGVALVVDASQALGKVACDLRDLGATAVVLTASKIGGPTGAAALLIERTSELVPTSFGGAQERGRRAGTPDVAALAGFAAAAEQLAQRLHSQAQIAVLRDRLEAACVAFGAVVNASEGPRVATVSNLSVRGWRGEVLVAALDLEGLCASSGAACSSGLGAPSPVLRALYPDQPWRAESALRLSLGPETSDDDVDRAIAILRRVLARSPA